MSSISDGVMHMVAQSTVVTTVAILLVALVRKPLRRIAGAEVAYWVWLFVPLCNVVSWLPAPSRSLGLTSSVVPLILTSTLPEAVASAAAVGTDANHSIAESIVWGLGALLMLTYVLHRQRQFVRSLGKTTVAPDGTHRSRNLRGPVLIGLWRPRIVVPSDFEIEYDADERALVIAHELAHQRRLDIPLAAVATMWLCVAWFNPVVHWAMRLFRSDQELACDAVVLAAGASRRRYSGALLKAQVTADSILPLPAGLHWGSTHPLKERILMIGRPLPSKKRRLLGALATLAFIAFVSLVVWAAQPATSHAQVRGERSDAQLLCRPFVPYAEQLLAAVERAGGDASAASSQEMRRAAAATFRCAESDTRLLSRAEADAHLAEVQRQFEGGTNTSVAVSAAGVEAAKAVYCEAAFSHLSRLAEVQSRRAQVGLTRPEEVGQALVDLEALVPVCGRPGA